MNKDNMKYLYIGVALLVIVVLYYLYKKGDLKEGYKHHSLGQAASGSCEFTGSPIDYAFKAPNFQKGNPHFKAREGTYYAPADLGKVDFYPDLRRLDAGDQLFEEFDTQWTGFGGSYIPNEHVTRARMTRLGYFAPARAMAGHPGAISANADANQLLAVGASPTVKL